jgi:hypothetical protein
MNEKRLLQDGERSCHQFWVTHGTEPEPAAKEKSRHSQRARFEQAGATLTGMRV